MTDRIQLVSEKTNLSLDKVKMKNRKIKKSTHSSPPIESVV